MSATARASLVVAPLVLVVARFLLVPYWDEEEVYVSQVAENPGRSDLGASLVIVGVLMLIPAAVTLARLVAFTWVALTGDSTTSDDQRRERNQAKSAA
jgi:hypothetical protein